MAIKGKKESNFNGCEVTILPLKFIKLQNHHPLLLYRKID